MIETLAVGIITRSDKRIAAKLRLTDRSTTPTMFAVTQGTHVAHVSAQVATFRSIVSPGKLMCKTSLRISEIEALRSAPQERF